MFQESEEWISNSHDYKILGKHLWRNLNLSGLASWSGKENSVEIIAVLNNQ